MTQPTMQQQQEALLLIGIAVGRRLKEVKKNLDDFRQDDSAKAEFAILFRWLETWLTPDEVAKVSIGIGVPIGREFVN